jgi:hypothetical protein
MSDKIEIGDWVDIGRKAAFKVIGPEEFEGYEYNRPSKDWELVEASFWIPRKALIKVDLKTGFKDKQ